MCLDLFMMMVMVRVIMPLMIVIMRVVMSFNRFWWLLLNLLLCLWLLDSHISAPSASSHLFLSLPSGSRVRVTHLFVSVLYIFNLLEDLLFQIRLKLCKKCNYED